MPNHNIPEKRDNGGADGSGRFNAAEMNELLRLLNLMPLPITGIPAADLRLIDAVYPAGTLIVESDTLTRKLADGLRAYSMLPPLATGRAEKPTGTILAAYRDPAPWTPILADHPTEGNVASATTAEGSWMQIGNMIHLSCKFTGINKALLVPNNSIYIRGLPAAVRPGPLNCFTTSIRTEFITFNGNLTPFLDHTDRHVLIYQNVSGAGSLTLRCSGLADAAASALRFSLSFFTE